MESGRSRQPPKSAFVDMNKNHFSFVHLAKVSSASACLFVRSTLKDRFLANMSRPKTFLNPSDSVREKKCIAKSIVDPGTDKRSFRGKKSGTYQIIFIVT